MGAIPHPEVLKENQGISAIVGFILVIGIVNAALATYLSTQVPWEWKEKEQNMVGQVKQNFLEFRGNVAG
ncbi:MAG: hypothetical protein QXG38_00940, partial [Candidatus Hadarchaeales archaeon]